MKDIALDDLMLSVPERYTIRSLVLAPPPAAQKTPVGRAALTKSAPYQRNVALSRLPVPEGFDLVAFIANQERAAASDMPGFLKITSEALDGDLKGAVLVESQVSLDDGRLVRTLTLYAALRRSVVTIVGSDLAGAEWPDARAELAAILQSLKSAGD